MSWLSSIVTSISSILILSIVFIHGNKVDYDYEGSEANLPLKSDLVIYLKALRRILQYCSKHKHDLDMNFEFGLFLTSVNLKKALFDPKRRIPEVVHGYIVLLSKENDDLIEFFDYMVKQDHDPKQESNKKITTLFSDETQWLKQLHKFDPVQLESEESDHRLNDVFSSWKKYLRSVDDMDRWIPHPGLSDMCMVSLAKNEVHHSVYLKCKVYSPCYDMLTNGTDFGYALSHRILFLLNARYSRGCSIFSKEQDKALTIKFCTKAFNEAKFIAGTGYKVVDLLLEQMCLCTLNGYPQFLQRSWLSYILRYQTLYGCFGQNLNQTAPARTTLSRHPRSWTLAKHRDHRILDGLCDGHVTAVAAATLASAVRYILEMYF